MGINRDHEPGPAEERVVAVFKSELEEYGESRMTPQLIRERLNNDDQKQTVNYALGQLRAAGWIQKLGDGLYEFVDDPREKTEE